MDKIILSKDESELFRARQGEAAKLEPANMAILIRPAAIEDHPMTCPRDGKWLTRFSDEHFPEEIILEQCPACRGLWLNRGHFIGYQRFREQQWTARIETPGDPKLRAELQQLVDEYQAGKSTETLQKLGKFLSTPMDPGAPRNAEAEQAVSTVMGVVMALLRAFVLRF
ncbi:zf-TFIIB domain-containing protein [Dehalogenimonas sp. THU2]|uniref:zf-TFIIB domain-containing protein n=1 Tax=Dehalogenimonas sp. THU2 TaxID=3151121 RepID=UPI0032185073